MRNIPFWAVCAIVFVIPWEEMAILGDMESVAMVLGYLASALAFMTVLATLRIRRPPLAFVPLVLMAVWNWLSLFWSVDPDVSRRYALTYVSLLLFAWMIWEFSDSEKRICWVFRAYLFGCCLSLTSMFLSYVPGAVGEYGHLARFTGGDLNLNDIAAVLNIAIPLAAYLAFQAARGTRMRTAYWAFIPVAAIGVLLTGSRTGVLVLGGGLSLTALSVLSKGLKPLIPFIIVIAFGLWLMPKFVSEDVFSRVAEGTEAGTFKLRLTYWKAGFDFWQKHPIEGAGVGAFPKVTALEGVQKPNVSHNTFITVLVEKGIVGAALMLTFWFMLFRIIWAQPKRDRFLWLTLFGIWTVTSMAVTWEYSKSTWFLYGAALAFCALPKRNAAPKQIMPVRRQANHC